MMRGIRPPFRRFKRSERGAALLEMALITPFFMAMLFGVIDFGSIFDDSGQLEQSTRQTAHDAAVVQFGASNACNLTGVPAGTSDGVRRIICSAKANAGLSSDVRVNVMFTNGTLGTSDPRGFTPGNSVVVCTSTRMASMSGMYDAMLENHYLRARAAYRIEEPSTFTETAGGEVDPGGTNWSWCAP